MSLIRSDKRFPRIYARFDITQHTVATRERFLQLTQSKFRHGAASRLDVNRAEASLAFASSNVPDLQRQIVQSENQLQILLGRNPALIARERRDLQAMPVRPRYRLDCLRRCWNDGPISVRRNST